MWILKKNKNIKKKKKKTARVNQLVRYKIQWSSYRGCHSQCFAIVFFRKQNDSVGII